ncbi:pentatricopeptide repeat-containing protein At3g49740-like [Pistacia vera]|uniref:pentatricopeptide repeat-containing protein At3g49740-like n=1 Tax=Pistacia vera TaxID=55513 RepID=UPI001263B34E|nr:pentatricopeptide repeat-containing protein At3g49740-like [Pistacia vera]
MTQLSCKIPSTATTTNYCTKQLLIKLNNSLVNFTRSCHYQDALHLFVQLHSSHDLKPDIYTLSTTLTACANLRKSTFGNQLHAYTIRTGHKLCSHVANSILSLYKNTQDFVSVKRVFSEIENPDVYSWTTLLSACTKMGHVGYACELFDKMPSRELAVYNAMINGCVENGHEDIGISLFGEMHKLGIRQDKYSLGSVLSVCDIGLVELGRQLHSLVIKTGFLVTVSVVNALITMYFNCGIVADASMVFEEAKKFACDNISFNVMMGGLVSLGKVEEALMMFRKMLQASYRPSKLTFVSVMSACFCVGVGSQVHAQAIKNGFEALTSVSNAAITMYSTCGDLDAAQMVFQSLEEKDLVSWNTMISSYAQRNLGRMAISAYLKMERVAVKSDEFTFGSLLASSEFEEIVEMIHALVFRNGIISNIQVSNALISAYSKHEQIKHAYQIFHDMSYRNLVTWNTIISGFLLNSFPVQGLEQFCKLLMSDARPDVYTLTIVLSICASLSSLRHGKQVHGYILRYNLFSKTSLGNALISMYTKCGNLNCSVRVFNEMIEKDTVSWNALISAYAQHGEGKEAISCFEAMQDAVGLIPDHATFTAVLSACSHAGLVDDGTRIFNCMVNYYGFVPAEDHLSCMLDLLGRAGYLDEAERLINKDIQVPSSVWWALFSACAAHASGLWEEAANIRELSKRTGVMKQPGCSWIGS